jgi:hypothetical protein
MRSMWVGKTEKTQARARSGAGGARHWQRARKRALVWARPGTGGGLKSSAGGARGWVSVSVPALRRGEGEGRLREQPEGFRVFLLLGGTPQEKTFFLLCLSPMITP